MTALTPKQKADMRAFMDLLKELDPSFDELCKQFCARYDQVVAEQGDPHADACVIGLSDQMRAYIREVLA